MFVELVEQVASHDETLVKVAKSRLNPEIAMLVHNKQEQGELSCRGLCTLMHTKFTVEVSVNRAWQNLDSEQYDWEGGSPQAFKKSPLRNFRTGTKLLG